jgi:hypothetical protein
MFYTDSSNNRYRIGKPFTYEGYYYGTALATHAKFMELGFTQVIVQQRPDSQYYIVSGPDNTGAYSSTPRNLAELKLNFKLQQKRQAHQTLRNSDWYVIRSQELGVVAAAVPVSISAFRSAYRTVSDTRCIQIDACTTVQELETLMKAPEQLYNDQTETYSVNPAALTPWPEPLATTYDYL